MNQRPEIVRFQGQVNSLDLHKDGTIGIRLTGNIYPGLVDMLLAVQNSTQCSISFMPRVFQMRLETKPTPIVEAEGCKHPESSRRYLLGSEICQDCGTFLGDCLHPQREATNTETGEGICLVCGEKVSLVEVEAEPDPPATDEPDEPKSE